MRNWRRLHALPPIVGVVHPGLPRHQRIASPMKRGLLPSQGPVPELEFRSQTVRAPSTRDPALAAKSKYAARFRPGPERQGIGRPMRFDKILHRQLPPSGLSGRCFRPFELLAAIVRRWTFWRIVLPRDRQGAPTLSGSRSARRPQTGSQPPSVARGLHRPYRLGDWVRPAFAFLRNTFKSMLFIRPLSSPRS